MNSDHPLRLLSAALALGPSRPELTRALGAAAVDWPRLLALASRHLVTPALTEALRNKGLFDAIPAAVQDYLDGMHTLNRLRNADLVTALADIAGALNPLGIQPLLLKGANALVPGACPGAAERVIGDLDLLIPAHREPAAEAALRDLGYRSQVTDYPNLPGEVRRAYHAPPLLHPAGTVAVELHRRLVANVRDAAWLEAGLHVTPYALARGEVVLLPDPETRLLHNCLHSQISNRQRCHRRLDLRQLLDFAALAHRHPAALDAGLLARLRPGRRRVFLEYLAQADYWLGLERPPGLPRAASEAREIWLQERVQTHPGWRRLFATIDNGVSLLPRLARLPLRLVLTPRWLGWWLRNW